MCDYQNWIGGMGVCELWKNNVLVLLISSQKLYFGDNVAIYDVIIQKLVWKWRNNYKHEISKNPFAKTVLFQTYSTIFIFMQIVRANFAVRGHSSLWIKVTHKIIEHWSPLNNVESKVFIHERTIKTSVIACIYRHLTWPVITLSTTSNTNPAAIREQK